MSLKYRIAVVMFLLEAVMMTFVLATTVNRSQSINKENFEINENVILELLADLSRVALFSFEYEELQPYIENISADPHVVKILIIDRQNRITASSDVNDVGGTSPNLSDSDNNYWRTVDINNESGYLGRIAMNFSHDAVVSAKKEIFFAGLKVAIMGMTIIAIVGMITGYLLTRRIGILSKAANHIEKGNLDIRTNLPGHDEVAHLGQVFDHMAASFKSTIESLHTRESELKKIQDELELRVEERTSELELVNEELEHLATHDPLTNLPNRSLMLVKLHQAISQANIDKTNFATIIMDLDKFKQVNDSLGHAIGDELLIQASTRISNLLRKTDTVARIGGDEFSIILTNVSSVETIAICEKISKCLANDFIIRDNVINIGSSIGIAMFPQHSTDSSVLLKYADMAMYVAKRSHYDYAVYDSNDSRFSATILSLDSGLRNAIKNDELILHYQPKVDHQSGNIVGVEALVRWQQKHHLVYPDDFIPYAEKSDLIAPLTKWVLSAAVQQLSEWNLSGIDFTMSVNLSTKNLSDSSLIDHITQSLNQWQVAPHKLILEITETSIMSDTNRALEVLRKLNAMGVGISIDDFGTGYSSLMYLKKLPVDEIKIDRSFVVDIETDSESLVIVRSIIDLAHNLGISVTAEGVETASTWKLLSSLGCNTSQGNYFGHPLCAEDFNHKSLQSLAVANISNQ
ncbi:bifunctional diguanylate cyclase/phosphodiesterase [Kaarinaea lacus]